MPKTLATWALAAAALAAAGPSAQAAVGDPPPGAIFDLAATPLGGNILSSYQSFTTSFVAAVPNTTISFAFREVPAFFAFDDASVTTGGGSNLLVNPGFELATVGQNVPTDWGRWIQPQDVSAIGVVASNGSPGGCPPNGAHGGSQFWCDGSVEGYDAVFQTIATTVGQTYDITFSLGDNSNEAITNPTIDMLVYATNGLPTGTVPVGAPEPASLLLLGSGVLAAAVFRRRRNG